jgi:hypothetical protein
LASEHPVRKMLVDGKEREDHLRWARGEARRRGLL